LRALVSGETAQAAFVGEAAPSEDSPVPATPEALVALCALHVRGTPVSWTPLFEGESARVVALPTYPWQRERLWMQERAGASGVASDARAGAEVVAPGAPDSGASGAARADARRGSEAYGELLRVPAPRRRTLLVDLLRARLANTLGLDEADSIGSDQLFFELGVSSISAVALQGELSEALGMELPSTVMFDHPSLERLARYISGRIDGGEPEERAVAREPQDGDLLAHLHGLTDAEAEALLLERLGRLE
jgi:acyl transferase domain-containing protein